MVDEAMTRAWILALAVGLASPAHAALDEDALGKAEGYPACPPALLVEPRCVVGLVTKRDESDAARNDLAGGNGEQLAFWNAVTRVLAPRR